MTFEEERSKILEMIETGTISAAEGLQLIDAIQDANDEAQDPAQPDWVDTDPLPPMDETYEELEPVPDVSEDIRKWKRWWMVPMWIGVGIAAIFGLVLFFIYQSRGVGFWFACMLPPFIAGLFVILVAVFTRNSPWLHVRVHQAPGEKPQRISISFPLPLRFAGWVMRTFGVFIPGVEMKGIDELITTLGSSATPETPLFIDVDEGEGGEKVQVFLG